MVDFVWKAIKGLHQRVVLRMAGMGPEGQRDGIWVYPPIGAALETVGLDEIGVYIPRRQNTVAQYIATRPIMDCVWRRIESWYCDYQGNGGSSSLWIS